MEADKRYRILVVLQRTDRPRYWDFFCPRCQYKVCELNNTEVVAMQDLLDYSLSTTAGIGVRCDGRYQGGHCGTWYYFTLSDRPARLTNGLPIKVTTTRVTIRDRADSPNF